MRINPINYSYSPKFGDALSTKQEKQFKKLMDEIDAAQGRTDNIRVAKIYVPSLPSSASIDTGIGKVNSREAKRFFEIANVYGGANAVKFMPLGQFTDKPSYSDHQYAGAYNRSSLSVGEDCIDLANLTTAKYGEILPKDKMQEFVKKHAENQNDENLVDFETTLGWQNQESYPVNTALKIAFNNFKNNKNPNGNLVKLREEFEQFKTQKTPVDYDDIYTRLALFPYLKDWATAKTDFFVGFDKDPQIRKQKMPEYNRLKKKYANEIEFYKFKQFLAHKEISEGKKLANSQGLKTVGDCILGFSWPEEQVFPDAFLKDKYGRTAQAGNWGLPVLNYYDLINEDDSPARKLLRNKVAHYLNNYDGIRFDVGWAYMNPSFHYGDRQYIHLDAGTKITDFIEKTAREVKGKDFDQRMLMYECDANSNDFNLWVNKDKIDTVKGLVILSTEEEKNDEAEIGWGNLAFYKYNIGLGDDDFILGTNNHDKEGVLRCAKRKEKSSEQVGAMLRVFNMGKDKWHKLKDDEDLNNHIRKYSRGRFAEVELAKHSFIQSTDLIGREEKVDYHTGGKGHDSHVDYKNRLERNYEENYHRALQDGVGYNRADVKCFTMEIDGSAREHKELYEKAAKYSAYLQHKGGIYTRSQADSTNRADLDIGNMSWDEIRKLDCAG